jgi:hypothetical protein
MNGVFIGSVSGLITILIVVLFKRINRNIFYGLILSGIGFLYVGFTWTHFTLFTISILQALFFLLVAYIGSKGNLYFLAAGFLLHGIWDLIYPLFGNAGLLPPHYDLFCLTYDFILGFYLIIVIYRAGVHPFRVTSGSTGN